MKFPNKIFDFRLSKSHSLFTSMWKFQDWKKPRICDFFHRFQHRLVNHRNLYVYICLPSLCGVRPKMFTALTMVLFRSKKRFSDFFLLLILLLQFCFYSRGNGRLLCVGEFPPKCFSYRICIYGAYFRNTF